MPSFLLAPWKRAASFCKVTTSCLHWWEIGIISTRARRGTEASACSKQNKIWESIAPLLRNDTVSYSGCTGASKQCLLHVGRDEASEIEAGLQSCAAPFCSECLMGQSLLNPRLWCNFQITSWDCLFWDFQDFMLQVGFFFFFFCKVVFSLLVKCHCRNK